MIEKRAAAPIHYLAPAYGQMAVLAENYYALGQGISSALATARGCPRRH